jgi:hypothetical protein
VTTKHRGKLMHVDCLKKYDKKHPEYRIIVCMEEMFGSLLKSSNIIPNSRALFKYSVWFDRFLVQLYPNHPLLGNRVWMLMSTSIETRNLIFVARCLAVAVNTGETEALKNNESFNSVLSALETWTRNKIEHKSLFSHSKMTVSRNTVNMTDPRGFSLSLNNHLIESLYKVSKLATTYVYISFYCYIAYILFFHLIHIFGSYLFSLDTSICRMMDGRYRIKLIHGRILQN